MQQTRMPLDCWLAAIDAARRKRDTRRVRNRASSHLLLDRHQRLECLVHPVHDARIGAEIYAQCERMHTHPTNTLAPGSRKQTDFRFAKTIDRLHWIADQKQCAAIAFGPATG